MRDSGSCFSSRARLGREVCGRSPRHFWCGQLRCCAQQRAAQRWRARRTVMIVQPEPDPFHPAPLVVHVARPAKSRNRVRRAPVIPARCKAGSPGQARWFESPTYKPPHQSRFRQTGPICHAFMLTRMPLLVCWLRKIYQCHRLRSVICKVRSLYSCIAPIQAGTPARKSGRRARTLCQSSALSSSSGNRTEVKPNFAISRMRIG